MLFNSFQALASHWTFSVGAESTIHSHIPLVILSIRLINSHQALIFLAHGRHCISAATRIFRCRDWKMFTFLFFKYYTKISKLENQKYSMNILCIKTIFIWINTKVQWGMMQRLCNLCTFDRDFTSVSQLSRPKNGTETVLITILFGQWHRYIPC